MSEKAIRNSIKRHFERRGWLVVPYNPTGYGLAGFPDMILIGEGQVLFVETKRPGEKPTAKQAEWIEKINRRGVSALAATCIEDVTEVPPPRGS